MLNRRIYETIGLRYEDVNRLPVIVANVKKMLEEHADIDHRQILMVNVVSFGPSAVEFFVYTFTETTDWQTYHQVKEDVLLKIAAIVDEQGAEIAFPTQTVHLQMQNEPSR